MKVIIKNSRLSFNDLFVAKSIKGGKARFSATLICLNGDEEGNPEGLKTTVTYTNAKGEKVTAPHSKMVDLCGHVMKEKWGKIPAKVKGYAYNKADGSTYRDEYTNEEGDYWAGFEADTFYISAAKQEERCKDGQMTVLNQLREPLAANSGQIFSGCFVNAVIDIYAYNDEGKPEGVTASLEGVQLKAKGEALGITQIDAADDFEDEEFEDTAADADDLM